MKNPWHNEDIRLNDPAEQGALPIIHDGAIATKGVGDGRLFPAVIIDTSSRPDVHNLIKNHKYAGSGDVVTSWGRRSKKSNSICLILSIIRPSSCLLILEFELHRYTGFIDQIVQSQGLYIQSGQKGDTLSSTLDADRILAEIPSREFREVWDKIYVREAVYLFRKEGIGKREAKEKGEIFARTWREAWSDIRMGRHASEQNSDKILIIQMDSTPQTEV